MKFLLPFFLFGVLAARGAEPLVISDFEGTDYGAWTTTGTAFGTGPAHGTLPRQMTVEGFHGAGLVNSFNGGDDATGTLQSPPFKIERKFITFLIGGGGWANETCVNLLVDGKVVRTATGTNISPGGTERLEPAAWEVGEFAGREAILVVVDSRQGGWGHINVDDFVQTDDRANIPIAAPPVPLVKDAAREIAIDKKLLHFPVKAGARNRTVTISSEGQTVRRFTVELADGDADWWAPLEVSPWTGKNLRVTVDLLPEDSKALSGLRQSDTLIDDGTLYHEPLRPQLQFSPQRGWNNDPNGLVFFRGEYHAFFQHNPYGCNWGNMHWGHATSPDLVHWQQHEEALYPDEMGPMFSGSAVVDWQNTSGLGQGGQPPMVLFYTAAGNPTVQCMAYTLDGRTFTKYSGNPVIKQITGGNRDPKVFWHELTKRWVLVLYVGLAPGEEHTIQFFTSPNLKDWTRRSQVAGLFECPDCFELPVDGDPANRKWVLTAASSEYFVGSFDGQTFTPETPKLPGHFGRGFYAAQTFSDLPEGRRVQIGWGQDPSPGMPFNQLLMFPCELALRQTAEGPRLSRTPVRELATLHAQEWKCGPLDLTPDSPNPLADAQGELLEVHVDLCPTPGSEVDLQIRGLEIHYDAAKAELTAAGARGPAPLRDGRLQITVLTDRTVSIIFASDGLTFMPIPRMAKPGDLRVSLQVKRGAASLAGAEVYRLNSIWPASGSKDTADRH